MARHRKILAGIAGSGWLITFSDLMTLLLTFFVLLLSMASMDSSKLTRISSFDGKQAFIDHSGAAKVSDRIQLVAKIIENPENILEKEQLLKELIFPDELLPPGISRSTVEENMRILAKPEGVAIVLTEALIFAPGSDVIPPAGQKLLGAIVPLLYTSSADINISGHTDSAQDILAMGSGSGADIQQGRPSIGDGLQTNVMAQTQSAVRRQSDPYTLSGNRAIAVLSYFIENGKLEEKRFSVSGYGPDKPIAPNDTPQGRAQNRRVEILLKTTQWLGQY